MIDEGQRLFPCARCNRQVYICSECDRGQVYCAGDCGAIRRRESVRLAAQAKKVLLLTEGLLIYLDQDVVRALGRDLLAQPAIRWWVLNAVSPAILQMLQKGIGALLDKAPMKFAP